MSDYTDNKQHLLLGKGALDLPAYVSLIKSINYKGLITFEFTPHLYAAEKKYLKGIASSVAIFKKLYESS